MKKSELKSIIKECMQEMKLHEGKKMTRDEITDELEGVLGGGEMDYYHSGPNFASFFKKTGVDTKSLSNIYDEYWDYAAGVKSTKLYSTDWAKWLEKLIKAKKVVIPER